MLPGRLLTLAVQVFAKFIYHSNTMLLLKKGVTYNALHFLHVVIEISVKLLRR